MPDDRSRPRRPSDPDTDISIARAQHQQDALDAIDAAARLIQPWRASLAAGNPSIAVILQIKCQLDKALVETAQMVGLGTRIEIAARGERAA